MCLARSGLQLVVVVLVVAQYRLASGQDGLTLLDRLATQIEVRFDELPLDKTLKFISQEVNVPLKIDHAGIQQENVALETPVTLRLNQRISAKSALNLVLMPLRLDYCLRDGHIFITSEQEVARFPQWRRFKLSDWMDHAPNASLRLKQQIESTIQPDSWLAAGGKGKIRVEANGDLSVCHVRAVCEKVDEFLFERRIEHEHARTRRLQLNRDIDFNEMDLIDANRLTHTQVVPHTGTSIVPGKNIVYSVVLEAGWRELLTQLGEPVQIVNAPEVVAILNRNATRPNPLTDESVRAVAGRVDESFMARLQSAVGERFPEYRLATGVPRDENAVLLLAMFRKNLSLSSNFVSQNPPLIFKSAGRTKPVMGFGLACVSADDVTVLDYASDDDFILQLHAESDNDQLILAKVAPERTLEGTIASVRRRIRDKANKPAPLRHDEAFSVPVLELHTFFTLDGLAGKYLRNPGWEGTYFGLLEARIRFRLNERGFALEEELLVIGHEPEPSKLRSFVFDRPFLILAKERSNERPYFSAWVENPELMIPHVVDTKDAADDVQSSRKNCCPTAR